jgi:hypothetical protein
MWSRGTTRQAGRRLRDFGDPNRIARAQRPSPAAPSALALARVIADHAEAHFGLERIGR